MKKYSKIFIASLFLLIGIAVYWYIDSKISTPINARAIYTIDLRNKKIDVGNQDLEFIINKDFNEVFQEPRIYKNADIQELIDSRANVLFDGEYEESVNLIYDMTIEDFLKKTDDDLSKLGVMKLTKGIKLAQNLQYLEHVIKKLHYENMDWFLKPVEVIEYNKRKFEIVTLVAIPRNKNSKMNFMSAGEEIHHHLEDLKNREDLSVGMLKIKEKRSKLTSASEKISCEVINLLNFKFVREVDDSSDFDLDMQLSLVTNKVLLDSNYHIFANSYEHQFKPEHYDFYTSFKVVSNFYDNNEIAVKNFLYSKEEAIDGYIRKINILSFNDQSVLSIPIPFVQKIYEAS